MIYLASFFLLLGAIFCLVAAIGIVRMPDLYCRMHAATKAGAFGVSLMLIGLFCVLPTLRVFIQSIMMVLFFYLTAPIAGHVIGRVAMKKKVPMWTNEGLADENKANARSSDFSPMGEQG